MLGNDNVKSWSCGSMQGREQARKQCPLAVAQHFAGVHLLTKARGLSTAKKGLEGHAISRMG